MEWNELIQKDYFLTLEVIKMYAWGSSKGGGDFSKKIGGGHFSELKQRRRHFETNFSKIRSTYPVNFYRS